MELHSVNTLKKMLSVHGARPSKGMGQNFLVEKTVLSKIIKAADLQKTDTVLEVGPGPGVLTVALASEVGKVVAVEKDRAMVEILQTTLKGCNNVEVIQGDVLKVPSSKFQGTGYKVVANIPYYLT
jgi:16S rRNA (adenine1518-N6/adenine1519-N6)-dimethyltransferase